MHPANAPLEADPARRFAAVARLYGASAAARLRQSHAVVIGIGGVGCWAAEALARSAVGALTLIDLDHIAESNTNRQIHALGDAYGCAKVLAMGARITDINPQCRVQTIEEFITPDNVAALLPAAADVVLDCIDQARAKAALLAHCVAQGIAVVTCGAAGGRLDPTRIRHADLALVEADPLLAKVRYWMRRQHGFASNGAGRARKLGIAAVYSDEPIRRPLAAYDAHGLAAAVDPGAGLACAGYGSSVTVTAPLGFAAAAQAIGMLLASLPAPARGRAGAA